MNDKAFDETYPSGIKWTKQRKDVYHILIETGEPLSAQEIYNQYRATSDNYIVR